MLDFQDFIKDQALKANTVVRNAPYTGFANDSLKRNYPVFGQSDTDIANAKVRLHQNMKKVKWGCPGVLLIGTEQVAEHRSRSRLGQACEHFQAQLASHAGCTFQDIRLCAPNTNVPEAAH